MAEILPSLMKGARRSIPPPAALTAAISYTLDRTYGPGYSFRVRSGIVNEPKGASGASSSGRHILHGPGASDIQIYGPDGKQLSGAALTPFAQNWVGNFGSIGVNRFASDSSARGWTHVDFVRDYGKGQGPVWSYGGFAKGARAAIESFVGKGEWVDGLPLDEAAIQLTKAADYMRKTGVAKAPPDPFGVSQFLQAAAAPAAPVEAAATPPVAEGGPATTVAADAAVSPVPAPPASMATTPPADAVNIATTTPPTADVAASPVPAALAPPPSDWASANVVNEFAPTAVEELASLPAASGEVKPLAFADSSPIIPAATTAPPPDLTAAPVPATPAGPVADDATVSAISAPPPVIPPPDAATAVPPAPARAVPAAAPTAPIAPDGTPVTLASTGPAAPKPIPAALEAPPMDLRPPPARAPAKTSPVMAPAMKAPPKPLNFFERSMEMVSQLFGGNAQPGMAGFGGGGPGVAGTITPSSPFAGAPGFSPQSGKPWTAAQQAAELHNPFQTSYVPTHLA